MNLYNKGSFFIILGALLAFLVSIYYIMWSLSLVTTGPLYIHDLVQLQTWFWIFTIFSSLNICIWIYCTYKEVNLSLKGYFILSPFVMVIVACFSVLHIFNVTEFSQYINVNFSYETYVILLIFFDAILFWGIYIIIREKIG